MVSRLFEIKLLYPNIEYINYDYDLDEEDIIKYNIGDIVPVVIFEKDNIEIKRVIGEKSKKEILDIMEKILWKRY